jgi:hypothetical protein
MDPELADDHEETRPHPQPTSDAAAPHDRTVSQRCAAFLFMLPLPAPAALRDEEKDAQEIVDTRHSRALRPVIKAAWLEDRQL